MTINENEMENIKIKMLDEFYFEIKHIFRQYFIKNINHTEFKKLINKLYDTWQFCRFDLVNVGENQNSIKILSNESYLNLGYPKWLANGKGCVIETDRKPLKLYFECVHSGKFKLSLKGKNYKGLNKNRIPIYINYNNLIVNDSLVFDNNCCIWHNTPYFFTKECHDGEIIKIQLNYETLFDYYPRLIRFQNMINFSSDDFESIQKAHDSLEFFILQQKFNKDANDREQHEHDKDFYGLSKNINELKNNLNNLQTQFTEQADINHDLFSMLFLDSKINTLGTLNQVQVLSQELLNFIVNVCKKYELTYWLDWGTLLGAIRHNGYIPWDDDIDIAMLRCDLKKFLENFDTELKNYGLDKYISIKRDRIRGKNFLTYIQVFYFPGYLLGAVDIFPYDYIKNPSDDLKTLFRKQRRKFKTDLRNDIPRENAELDYFNELNISSNVQEHIISGIDGADAGLYLLETTDIYPLKEYDFNEDTYYCPNNYDKYLKKRYGNYRDLPEKIKRHNKRVKNLKKVENIDILFQNHINILKEVNRTFK